ncbi:MAG: hypothetical protein ACRDQA_11925, partial [Nocardioidaceae bacterium]
SGTMDVTVTPFRAIVQGTKNLAQGTYPVVMDANQTLTLPNGGATDVTYTIVVRIRDNVYDGSGEQDTTLYALAGSESVDGVTLPLREVTVPAGTSAGSGGLDNSNLGADLRTYTAALGGTIPVTGRTSRDNLSASARAGLQVFRMDTLNNEQFDGSNWSVISGPTRALVCNTYAHWPAINAAGTPIVYKTAGGLCTLVGSVQWSDTNSFSRSSQFSVMPDLPSAAHPSGGGNVTWVNSMPNIWRDGSEFGTVSWYVNDSLYINTYSRTADIDPGNAIRLWGGSWGADPEQ